MRVYVAGPYSADNVISVFDNIRRGIRTSTEVFLAGYSPFCPWLDFLFEIVLRGEEKLVVEDYYRYCLDWLDVAEAILVLPGWEKSKGTLLEIARAKELGIPIYYSLQELNEKNK
jgi:hypothetical protein